MRPRPATVTRPHQAIAGAPPVGITSYSRLRQVQREFFQVCARAVAGQDEAVGPALRYIFRWTAYFFSAVFLFFWFVVVLPRMQGQGASLTEIIISTLGAILGALTLSVLPEIANRIVDALGDVAASLWMPAARLERPPLNYKPAEYYLRRERWADAIEEFENITRYYPYEERAYRELVALADKLGDRRLRQRWERKWFRRFRKSHKRC